MAATARDAFPSQRSGQYGVLVGQILWRPDDLLRVSIGDTGSFNSRNAMKAFTDLGFDTFTETVYGDDKLPEVHDKHKRGPN
ncbi:hypothetical protein ACH4TC_01580 [Streptomyces spororaveus]|uniref:hypothetical protein n=1 Tax=Streptomyces spororaveus TaxID=284039 RepID=UPI0037BAEE01